MNALRRAVMTMEKYEAERQTHGTYPTATMQELLLRSQVYAQIAVAQEKRAANMKNGIVTDNTSDEGYVP